MPVSNLKFWLLWAAVMQAQDRSHDLIRQNIEDLMNVEVTTASKKEQKLSETAAAIYVITQEDIRRSGATSIAEALRMVPGVNVARLNSSQWAISARGFNGRFSDKLLVLMDGRSVYTQRFSGVYWDVQDTMLEDIERIEVIRGPGATLWGANAVNGVINIITKHTKDTQGTLVNSGGGSDERGFGAARLGGKLGDKAHFRVYGKYFGRGPSADISGRDAGDEWSALRGGFRIDSAPSSRDTLTMQGDTYHQGQSTVTSVTTLTPPYAQQTHDRAILSGGNLLGRWNRAFSNGSETTLQMYWDRTGRETGIFEERTDTLDLDFDHHTLLGGRQDVVWGLGYRLSGIRSRGGFPVSFDPPDRTDQLFSAFVQDEIAVVRDRFKITMGSKLERNDYTGVELQPSLRLLWTPDKRHSLWAAASRAVRTPAPGNTDLRVNASAFRSPDGTVNLIAIFGAPDFRSEKVFAYELGYRIQPSRRLSLDVAGFYNDYDDLKSTQAGHPFFETTPLPAHRVLPTRLNNESEGNTYGLEAAANWNATSYWKWSGGYTWLRMKLTPVGAAFDTPGPSVASPLFPQSSSPPGIRHGALLQRRRATGEDPELSAAGRPPGMASFAAGRPERGIAEPARRPSSGVQYLAGRSHHNADSPRRLREADVAILAMRDAQSRAQAGWRRLARIAGGLLLMACAGGAEKSGPGEYEVKAAFLYTFAQFTEWPAEAFDGPDAPLIIGVTGSDPFGHILDDAMKGESIHGRPAVIRRFQRGESLKACHVVFVGASERRQLPQILAELKGASVLTISEIDRFAYFGGIVTFTMEGPRVRFEINLGAAGQARLKISSKLLKLAKITGGAP